MLTSLTRMRLKQARHLLLLLAAILTIFACVVVWRRAGGASEDTLVDGGLRIRAGARYDAMDGAGGLWLADRWFTGGQASPRSTTTAAGPNRDILAAFQRQGDFEYSVPLYRQSYEMRLYFVNNYPTWTSRPGTFDFTVSANGRTLLSDEDPLRMRWPDNQTTIRVFRDIRPEADGKLRLRFQSGADSAFINGIELIPGRAGRANPIRILANDTRYRTYAGDDWDSDRYFIGGTLRPHTRAVEGPFEPALFASERYGTFSYAIPLARGQYQLTLFFCEPFFGPGFPGSGGIGSRRFDIYANNNVLSENFDVFKQAGGANRQLSLTFHHLKPDTSGYLNLSFVPRVNHAIVSAAEILGETN